MYIPFLSNLSLQDQCSFFTIIVVICVVFLIMLVIREINLWYWRINEIVNLLRKIKDNTEKKAQQKSDSEQKSTNN